MPILVVPMNPEYLPELALIIGALFTGVAALAFASSREFGRAARAGAASLACAAVVVVLVTTMHKPAAAPGLSPKTPSSMSLVLGGVVLRVPTAERYALSVTGTPVLDLDVAGGGLLVTGTIGADDRAFARVDENRFGRRWSPVRPGNPDDHTLVLQGDARDIFRLQYEEPNRIEVTGQFFGPRRVEPALISFENGIRWKGGAIAPGTVIDLRPRGVGRIDFGDGGEVRVVPGR